MPDPDLRTRWLHGALACAGLGALAGGLEAMGHAASLRLPLGAGAFLLVALACVALMAAAGGLAGLATGVLGRGPQAGLVAALLGAWYLVPAASVLASEGRPGAAIAMGLAPIGFGVLVGLFARAWPEVPSWALAATGLLLAIGATAAWSLRLPASSPGPAVIVVTIDGLRADDPIPGEWTIRFTEGVTPVPASRPAAATVLTGLHPLRHEVLGDDARLDRAWTTLAEAFEAAGWDTAAFVSSSALGADSGLAQGFATYDDAVRAPAGLWVPTALHRLPLGPAHRHATATLEAFARWAPPGRFLAWIQLDAPADLAVLDRPDALVIVVGSYGVLRGEHGSEGPVGLWDPVVRVPIAIRAPGLAVAVPEVTAQVRLMDVSPTALAWAGIDPIEPSEGVDLVAYGTGARGRSMSCTLADPGGRLVGLRASGIKYVRHVPDGPESLYDLVADPGETRDLAADQAAAVEQARGLVAPEEIALVRLLGESP